MYDVRGTIWMLARVARESGEKQRNAMKQCAKMIRKRRGRLTPPMYDLRGTWYDLQK